MTITPIPFADFQRKALEWYEPPMRAKATQRRMRYVLTILEGLGVQLTADLDADLIQRFIKGRPQGEHPNNTRGLLRDVRTLCNLAVGNHWLETSPFALRKQWVRGVKRKPKRFLSREEVGRLLAYLQADIPRKAAHKQSRGWAEWRARRLHALVATVAYTGLRKMEALTLRREDIDLERGVIQIRGNERLRLKTEDSGQPVPIPPGLAPILRLWLLEVERIPDAPPPVASGRQKEYLDNFRGHALDAVKRARHAPRDPGWVFPNTYGTMPWTGGPKGSKPLDKLKTAAQRAGLGAVTFLSLRHSWATAAEGWGLTPAQIQRGLRHTSPRTQHMYRHPEDSVLREIGAKITFDGQGPTAPNRATADPDSERLIAALEILTPANLDRLAKIMRREDVA